MSILKIEPSAINAAADFSLGSLSVTGNINVGAATIAATESGDLAFTTTNGSFDITANTVNFLNTVATTSIAPGGSIVTESLTPRIISVAYVGNDTAAAVAGGETLTITGSGFNYGASVYISGAIVAVVTVTGPTQITFTSPARSAGNYTLGVVNPDGASATFVPGIQYSGVPAWSTASGSLGAHLSSTAFSTTLTATSDSAVSYSIVLGSLPPGITLNALTGVVAGTLPAVTQSTTYNFTVSANDAENQSTDRNFSINVTAPAVAGQAQFVTAGTYSWTAPAGVTSVNVVAIGGGSGGVGQGNYTKGGPGGGLGWKNDITVVPGQAYTVVVGAGGSPVNDGSFAGAGGESYFINTTTVSARGGPNHYNGYGTTQGGTFTGTGGGRGGFNANAGSNSGGPGGAGGAGGYSGNGGSGGDGGSEYPPAAGTVPATGSGGGGGGGGGYSIGGTGGGVGILGRTTDGTAGASNGGNGGSGSGGTNQTYGGGGAGAKNAGATAGGNGAVRIIWGPGRAFPSTNTGNV